MHITATAPRPRVRGFQLVPLLLAVAVSQAYAGTIIGTAGADGVAGATPGAAGTAGGQGGDVRIIGTFDPGQNPLNAVGGAGGTGGAGAAGIDGQAGGIGGRGGDGGHAIVDVAGTLAGGVASTISAVGGAGGFAGTSAASGTPPLRAIGGYGGDAKVAAILAPAQPGSSVELGIAAQGGAFDLSSHDEGTRPTAGGRADADLTLSGIGGGNVSVKAQGGSGYTFGVPYGPGGAGGHASASADVTSSGPLTLQVTSAGGQGSGHYQGGASASAHATARTTGNAALNVTVSAAGGSTSDSTVDPGGTVQASVGGYSDSGRVIATVEAKGGHNGTLGAKGGNATLVNAVQGGTSGRLTLIQKAVGGQGAGNFGGDALSHATLTDSRASRVELTAEAIGGGHSSSEAYSGGSANAAVTLTSTVARGVAVGTANATSGGHSREHFAPASARSEVTAKGNAIALANAHGTYARGPAGRTEAVARAMSSGTARAETISSGVAGTIAAHSEAFGGSGGAIAKATTRYTFALPVSEASAYAISSGAAGSTADAKVERGVGKTTAISTGKPGWRVETTGTNAGGLNDWRTVSTTSVGGKVYDIGWRPGEDFPEYDNTSFSHATLAPTAAGVTSALTGSPKAAAALAAGETVALGMMGSEFMSTDDRSAIATANFAFTTTAKSYLTLALLDSAIQPYMPNIALTVSNHGTQLYSGSFDDLAQARRYFTDHVLYLGALEAGAQDLLVTAVFFENATTDYTDQMQFTYAFGISAVPEPQTWILMLLGSVFVFRAGRRKG